MPALDEGTTLDMPITVPRASVTQAADDLKARDALLRGFPEVESVIGKAGRADTPTDPAPLDMVETFVNFRPKELWPKRVLRYADAERQTRTRAGAILRAMDSLQLTATHRRPQEPDQRRQPKGAGAVRRNDARTGAACGTTKFEQSVGPIAHAFCRRRIGAADARPQANLTWPAGTDEQQQIDELAAALQPEVWALAGQVTRAGGRGTAFAKTLQRNSRNEAQCEMPSAPWN